MPDAHITKLALFKAADYDYMPYNCQYGDAAKHSARKKGDAQIMMNYKALPMQQFPIVLITLSTLTGITMAGTGQTEPVPIYDEPQHHLLLEHANARVLDVQIPPGYVSLFHIHENDIFYATMDGSEVTAEKADGGIYRGSRNSGYLENVLSYRAKPVIHRVTNEGTSLFRIIAVENLTPLDDDEPLEAGRLATLGIPVIENSRFRAYQMVLEPGATVGGHRHPYPSLLLQMTEGNSVIRSGESQLPTGLNRGAWVWLEPGTEHSYTNMGGVTTTLVEIEIRSHRARENLEFTASGFLPAFAKTIHPAWSNNNGHAATTGRLGTIDPMANDEFTAHNRYITRHETGWVNNFLNFITQYFTN